MLDYKVEINGSLRLSVGEVGKLLQRNTTTALNAVMVQAHKIARDPIPSGPAKIKRSIGIEKATYSSGIAKIGTSHPKFQYVEEDTRAHVIRPKNKKALYFNGKFAMKVNHPGTKGKHSMAKADAFVERNLELQIGNAVNAAMSGKAYSPLTANLISALQSFL